MAQPSGNDIDKWMQHSYAERIEYALEHGNYETRKLAAEALGKLGFSSSIPVLFKTIDDKVQNVSIAALNALEKIGCRDELGAIIIKKRFNWVKEVQEKQAKWEATKNKKYHIYRWERTSKKNFELVKERLKRPIRWS
ncbi:HEAT repeat domain-containing protein [Seonamhaeicola sp.]|uniref:HEAT repeat domain-containing protein n=1 Tax=Seonamhaeicola sp. TaxID=1912245 RepID=UPI002633FF85|nr:HEAT repeat domain-containing protein [Seonamhaeicola sp.]